jgi:hypothetical protein
MTKYFLLSLIALAVAVQPQSANVEAREGVSIFYLSKPVNKYTTVASFKVKQQFTGEPKEQIETALKKLHKEYPSAAGLIFIDVNMQQAEAIKFE